MKLFPLAALVFAVSVGCSKPEEAPPPAPKNGMTTTATIKPAEKKPGVPAKYMAVQDIFTKNCMPCHSATKHTAGVNLSNFAGVTGAGKDGKTVTPGNAKTSKIVMALHGQGVKQMPPSGPLPDATIKLVEDWINAGAKLE